MLWIFKIGSKVPGDARYWLDGQLVDIMPSETKLSALVLKHFLVIEDGLDYWTVRGDTDWKSTKESVLEFRKLWSPVDGAGLYPWESKFDRETVTRKRNQFIDFKDLLDQKIISSSTFTDLYTKSVAVEKLNLSQDITQLLKTEGLDTRLVSEFSETKGSIASGTYSIGAAGDYATVTLFEADIASQLTGNLTGEHASEETAISSSVNFDTDTNSYLLKLTAASGAEHNGVAGGEGARINYGTADWISVDETNDGDLDDLEISKLAIDASGSNNMGVYCLDGGNSGLLKFDRLLIKADANIHAYGIIYVINTASLNVQLSNSILYGASASKGIHESSPNAYHSFLNNTIIGCNVGIHQDLAYGADNQIWKNNLCQGNTTDYVDDGGGFGTHAYNISEDATSPDVSYQSKDLHTNSIFKDYSSNDYRLDSAGDATNLAIADDGEDLSGTFTDDIQGQTRSTWYIGASEIVSSGGGISIPVVMHHRLRH